MILRLIAPLLFVCLLCSEVGAQNKKKSKGPTSLNSSETSKEVYAPKTSRKKKSSETTYDARDKYYDRAEQLGKTRRKSEKLSSNPQYTNFQYFGHKKPPKKRAPEKMKFCKICGIRH